MGCQHAKFITLLLEESFFLNILYILATKHRFNVKKTL